MTTRENEEIAILHISDVHTAYKHIQGLKEWLSNIQTKIDITLLSGDITQMPMDHSLPKEEVEKFTQDFRVVLDTIAVFCPNVLYIPGNHDHTEFYPEMEDKVTVFKPNGVPMNIHNKIVKLRSDLYIVGYGGSIPVYKDGEQFWLSYPLLTEEEFTKEASLLLDPISNPENTILRPNDSVIVMVHNGPEGSSTAVDTSTPYSPTYSGSTYLKEFLCRSETQKRVFLMPHGHTHLCSGKVQIGGITVSNPGALKEGRFALYTLQRGCVHPDIRKTFKGQWAVTSYAYHMLKFD